MPGALWQTQGKGLSQFQNISENETKRTNKTNYIARSAKTVWERIYGFSLWGRKVSDVMRICKTSRFEDIGSEKAMDMLPDNKYSTSLKRKQRTYSSNTRWN